MDSFASTFWAAVLGTAAGSLIALVGVFLQRYWTRQEVYSAQLDDSVAGLMVKLGDQALAIQAGQTAGLTTLQLAISVEAVRMRSRKGDVEVTDALSRAFDHVKVMAINEQGKHWTDLGYQLGAWRARRTISTQAAGSILQAAGL